MIKHFAAVISAILLLAVNPPAQGNTVDVPAEKSFPSSAGEVVFHHQMHIKDLGIKCVVCHHSIDAKKLVSPHPEYLKSPGITCGICHSESEKIIQKNYTCPDCHPANPSNIADETRSAQVVIHKQCWKCHPVGTGKEASTVCGKCHTGKKTF